MNPTFEQVAALGFIFPGARMWATKENMARIAQDAALITTPNTTVPAEFLAYIDSMVIEIMTAPRRAREIFTEEKKGDWTTPYMKWRVDEIVGSTQPYSDYANGTTSGINSEWQTRQQYVFQTSITYGDLEVAMSSAAKVNLAAAKQRAAARVIDVDANKFYLRGVQGREIYGILNDPNLPASITAAATGTGGSTKWADKTTTQIYNDILALFAQLTEQSSGLIDKDTPLKLVLSPEMSVRLGAATDFNVSVLDMLNKYFTSLTIVTLPENPRHAGFNHLPVDVGSVRRKDHAERAAITICAQVLDIDHFPRHKSSNMLLGAVPECLALFGAVYAIQPDFGLSVACRENGDSVAVRYMHDLPWEGVGGGGAQKNAKDCQKGQDNLAWHNVMGKHGLRTVRHCAMESLWAHPPKGGYSHETLPPGCARHAIGGPSCGCGGSLAEPLTSCAR